MLPINARPHLLSSVSASVAISRRCNRPLQHLIQALHPAQHAQPPVRRADPVHHLLQPQLQAHGRELRLILCLPLCIAPTLHRCLQIRQHAVELDLFARFPGLGLVLGTHGSRLHGDVFELLAEVEELGAGGGVALGRGAELRGQSVVVVESGGL